MRSKKIARIFCLLRESGVPSEYRAEIALSVSNGRTDSLKALSDDELTEAVNACSNTSQIKPGQTQRRRILSLAYSINWTFYDPRKNRTVPDLNRINNWCKQYGSYHKPLNDHTVQELVVLVAQFEQMSINLLKKK